MADRNGQDTQSGDVGIKTHPEGLNWRLPWLGIAGGLWFAMAFAFEAVFFNGDVCTSWNGWGGALGWAVLGFTLALYDKVQADKNRK